MHIHAISHNCTPWSERELGLIALHNLQKPPSTTIKSFSSLMIYFASHSLKYFPLYCGTFKFLFCMPLGSTVVSYNIFVYWLPLVILAKKSSTPLNDNHKVPRNNSITLNFDKMFPYLYFFNRPWWSTRIYMQLLFLDIYWQVRYTFFSILIKTLLLV